MMKNYWELLSRPILALAPMAGYTESPFRRLIKSIEPSVVLTSELISVEGLCHGNQKTRDLIAFHPDEKKYYNVQLFGNDTEKFIESAKILEKYGVDGIDINLGCPSPKVIGSGHGSALLKNPKLTAKMLEKLVKSTKLPISVKMRLGFYDDSQLLQTTLDFENAGIKALAIHGRTTKQKFSGQAMWSKIYEVKEHLKIPIIGNGDITSAIIAKNKIQNLDGVMIGRAAMRNPWIFKQCREAFEDRPITEKPSIERQLDFFRKQAKLSIKFKNESWAMIELRKHFAHFCRGFRGASQFREKLIRVSSYQEMEEIFTKIKESKE